MGITPNKKKNTYQLAITSNSAPDSDNPDASVMVLSNDTGELEVFVFTKNSLKSKHQSRVANLLMKLWNEYDKLPSRYKMSPDVLFRCVINSEKLIEAREKEIETLTLVAESKQEEIDSLTWWSKVYRGGYLLIILGLIVFALIK